MQMFLIITHLLIVFGLVCVILIQSSDSSAFGASSSSNFFSRGAHNDSQIRFTSILAFLFFATSISLSILSRYNSVKYREVLRQYSVDSKNKTKDSNPIIPDSTTKKNGAISKSDSSSAGVKKAVASAGVKKAVASPSVSKKEVSSSSTIK
ncbi:MAG: preprotein translocase subunit SecG [Candidatus Liberibacter europaeus]|uniref:Protein-export membrane protein SecG n=1 Tax=Candidatus Liberibacter europaeus TaxID=744859 RepID=A0A2T4VXE4_9HYPH|nr:preprotein translocase subunit SecG [Candidatus Liberibacter europaeus]PTL86452.1 MAG: preprotein translocase subunit SecG [Candidatus Liberibacter europaeus]